MATTKKPMNEKKDAKADKAKGIKEGGKADTKKDKAMGLPYAKGKTAKKC